MTDQTIETLSLMRTLVTELLSSIDALSASTDDPHHFRHRLLRGHALAVLDEVEQLASERPVVRPCEAPRVPASARQ